MSEKTIPGKRGRKPFGDHAMTAAERKRQSRNRQAAQGSVEFMIRLSGGTLEFVDEFALHNGVTRSQVVEAFLDASISRVAVALADAEQMQKDGGSLEQAADIIKRAIEATPQPGAMEKYREVMGLN